MQIISIKNELIDANNINKAKSSRYFISMYNLTKLLAITVQEFVFKFILIFPISLNYFEI